MVGEHCDYKRHRRGPKAGLVSIILILLLPSLMGGWEWRGWVVKWLKAGVQAGQTGLLLDTFPSIPRELPGNGQGPLCSSCSQQLTVARLRETKRP